ncbi:MAG: PilZ domain-containing protein [Acidobacteriota bacterium]
MSALCVLLGGQVEDIVPQRILRDDRIEIVRARDGWEAERLLASTHPAVAILQAEMADVPGYEVCRRARAGEATRDVPIVLVTDGEGASADACLSSPCDGVIERSALPDRVLLVLERFLNTRQRIPIRMMVRVGRSIGAVVFFGYTIDISDRGMLFEAPEELALEERIDLHFFLPACSEKIAVKGRVVRILDRSSAHAAGETGYGIEFLDLGSRSRERIRQYVENQGISSGPSSKG